MRKIERSLPLLILKQAVSKKMNEGLLCALALAGALCVPPALQASDYVPSPPGGDPCEADWTNRSDFRTMGFTHQVKYLEAAAERGHVDAQLRLGLLRRAQDGGWEAPADRSYNIKWLQKAVDQGSKSAAWELARILYPRGEISHEGFLRAAMAAAEEEGNPWAATYLMKLTSGRWGEDRNPSECTVVRKGDTCAPESLLPISSAAKWARIAGEGGNAWAQEWLCISARIGRPQRGQPADADAAYKWCSIASYQSCTTVQSYGPISVPFADRTKPLDPAERAYWAKRGLTNQAWRRRSSQFFVPNDIFNDN